MAVKKSYPFEQSLEKLEQLVERMEEGDLSLEDSLKTFEEGIKLTRQCQQALVKAEQKVKLLKQLSMIQIEMTYLLPQKEMALI